MHFIMTSLPHQFNTFKVNYNYLKEKWSISYLIVMCLREEERILAHKKDHANLVGYNKKREPKNKLHQAEKS